MFSKGRATMPSELFIRPKEGEPITFAAVVGTEEWEYARIHQHWEISPFVTYPCIGKDCPGEEIGNEPRLTYYLPVLLKGETQARIYPFHVKVAKQFEAIEDSIDEKTIKGMVFKVTRSGAGKLTNYTVVALGKKVDVEGIEVPEYQTFLGPQTREGIIALLTDRGLWKKPVEYDELTDETDSGDEVAEDEDWGTID